MATNPTAESDPAAHPAGPTPVVDEDQTRLITDAAIMRAMAHPARMTILDHLGGDGPATATECAEVVGLSPSATSYHLRALARAGLVEEAPGRGDARERVWRSAVSRGYTVMAERDAAPDVRAAEDELIETMLAWETARARQYLARRDDEPADWYYLAMLNVSALSVTASEMEQLTAAVIELVRPYRKRERPDPPPGARTVSAMLRFFPTDKPVPVEEPVPAEKPGPTGEPGRSGESGATSL
jgi:DNA-binding transcriptional ArsR family regulator